MPYDHYDYTLPDPSIQDGDEVFNSIRINLNAMRDSIVIQGFVGWNYTPSGGTADQPAVFLYSKEHASGEWEYIKGEVTWGTSGGEDGNVTQVVYSYSTDDITYVAMGTKTITYDADGYVTGSSWS